MTSKEYADKISETVDQAELKDAYEGNLIAMGKDSANQIQDAYKNGKINALKYVMSTYSHVKEYFKERESGLSWEAIESMLADISIYVMEDVI